MSIWTPERAAAIGARLAERARQSVLTHREYRTVRREGLHWADTGLGVRQALLNATDEARTLIVALDAGAALPWPVDATAQEVLVVSGELLATGEGVAQRLGPHGYALRAAPDGGTLAAAAGPVRLYMREMTMALAELPEPEAAWWRLPRRGLEALPFGTRQWRPTFAGVEVMPLWGYSECTSMLVRFAPGAGVPDHHHAAHEDCLMLEGEMFLGDILLRPGDYQLAPAGGGHFGEMSDVGGTFFFHGAIDPVLVPPKS